MESNLRIHITKPFSFGFDGVKIYMVEERGKERFNITIKEDGLMELNKLPEQPDGKELKAFLNMPAEMFEQFTKGLLQYAADNGIKADAEKVIEGKYSATLKHLEDMRTIVFQHFPKESK